MHKVTIIVSAHGSVKELYIDDKAIYAMEASVDWEVGQITRVSFTVPSVDVEFITEEDDEGV